MDLLKRSVERTAKKPAAKSPRRKPAKDKPARDQPAKEIGRGPGRVSQEAALRPHRRARRRRRRLYVVHKHDARRPHCDLRLEHGRVLLSWVGSRAHCGAATPRGGEGRTG